MRSKDCGMIPNVSERFTEEQTWEMFEKICLIRAFELNVKKAFDAKMIKMPIYLSLGQESVAAALATVFKEPAIFGQHRCHDLYLAYGGDRKEDIQALIDELLHRPTGCAGGMGGSASIHNPRIHMFGHDGLMGTQVAIGTGYVFSDPEKRPGLIVIGDASAEEDWVMPSMAFAKKHNLPILFVCMDNNLSILTEVKVRRYYRMVDTAFAVGMTAVEITDDPWLVMHYANAFGHILPAFLNVHTVRHLWHSGTGTDGPPEWDRFALIKEEFARLGLHTHAKEIEERVKNDINAMWAPEFV